MNYNTLYRRRLSKTYAIIFAILIIVSNTITAFASTQISLEEVYTLFGGTLPTWGELKEFETTELTTDKETLQKKNAAAILIRGFSKSGTYSKFKAELEKVSTYTSEYKELVPIDEEVNRKDLDKLMNKFDFYVTAANLAGIAGEQERFATGNLFTNFINFCVSIFIAVVTEVMYQGIRIGTSLYGFFLTMDMIYLAIEQTRPFLSKKRCVNLSGIRTRPVHADGFGQTSFEDSVGSGNFTFSFCTSNAIKAAEVEYRISERTNEVARVTTLWSYLKSSIVQMAIFLFAASMSISNGWGNLILMAYKTFGVVLGIL